MLTYLFSLFYVTGEFHRFLHRGRAHFSGHDKNIILKIFIALKIIMPAGIVLFLVMHEYRFVWQVTMWLPAAEYASKHKKKICDYCASLMVQTAPCVEMIISID